MNFDNLRLSSYPSTTSFFDFHKPTLVSCLASPRYTECKKKSFVDISSILPSLEYFAIPIVKCPILGSCLRMNKVLFLSNFLSVDPKWIERDRVSLLGAHLSLLFLFLSILSCIHESMPIMLEVVPREPILNIFLLAKVSVFRAKEKEFFRASKMIFE